MVSLYQADFPVFRENLLNLKTIMKRDREYSRDYRYRDENQEERRKKDHRPQDSQKHKKPWDRENYYGNPDDYADERY